jgi:N-acetylmuramoyl-L-alanine amidase
VTIEIAPPAAVTAMVETGRVVLHVDADALDLSALGTVNGGLVDQVRAGDQPNTVAVALASGAGTARTTTASDTAATRVAIDVPMAGAPPPDSTASRPSTSPSSPPPSLGAPRAGVQTIAIDPGHGGDDIGVKGPGGALEKDLTLDVARRLRGLIEMRLGIRVVMTRDDDHAVPLDQRAAIANNNKAGLFISLHANAALSPKVAGAEIYHLRFDQELEEVRREAEDGAVALPVLGGGARTIDVIRWDLAQARHLDASSRLATLLSEALGMHVPMGARKVQAAPLRVLEGVDMPAALIEMAYLTNPDQEKQSASDDFRNGVAQAIFDTITRLRNDASEGHTQ